LRGTLTITSELDRLFHQLFEEGKEEKYTRPLLPVWIESLEKAASKTLMCPRCKMSYYDDLFTECPYCKSSKPKRLVVESYYYKEREKREKRWQYVQEILEDTKKIELSSYIFKAFDILEVDTVFLEIKFPNKSRVELSFHKTDEEIYFESKTPMLVANKRVGLKKVKEGISIITQGIITTIVEIKIEE
jgi:hypothetical protein